MTIYEIITGLNDYWRDQGFSLIPTYDGVVGAATFHPQVFLAAALGKDCKLAFLQPCRRPGDALSCNKLDHILHLHAFLQYQVIWSPLEGLPYPSNTLELYEDSLRYLGIDLETQDFKYIEDHWTSPSLGAGGKGWEVSLNGLEITQITNFEYFSGAKNCNLSEIAYGVERLALACTGQSYSDLMYDQNIRYADLIRVGEEGYYHFKYPPTQLSFRSGSEAARELDDDLNRIEELIDARSFSFAYDLFLTATDTFNLSVADASIFQRKHYQKYMHRLTQTAIKLGELVRILYGA